MPESNALSRREQLESLMNDMKVDQGKAIEELKEFLDFIKLLDKCEEFRKRAIPGLNLDMMLTNLVNVYNMLNITLMQANTEKAFSSTPAASTNEGE